MVFGNQLLKLLHIFCKYLHMEVTSHDKSGGWVISSDFILLSLLQITHRSLLVSVSCSAGNYYNNLTSSCQPCGLGYYQDMSGQLRCKDCMNGYTTAAEGSDSSSDCQGNQLTRHYSRDQHTIRGNLNIKTFWVVFYSCKLRNNIAWEISSS